jgi:putative drug exporter of the RND superfamily
MAESRAQRWGRAVARRHRSVLAVWLALFLGCAALYPSLQHALGAPNYGIDGAESSRAAKLIEQRFAAHGAEQDVIVFSAPARTAMQPEFRAVVQRALAVTRAQSYVRGVAGPYDRGARGRIAADGHAAIALVGIAGEARQLVTRSERLQHAVAATEGAGVHVWLTGYSPIANDITTVEHEDVERAETIGLPVALLILLLALGTLTAALIPIALAISGLTLTFGVLALLSRGLTFDSSLTTVVTMIGVGIGIDYALFIVSRYREELAIATRRVREGAHAGGRGAEGGRDPNGEEEREIVEEAIGAAIASSGKTVLVSGAIVGLALSTLVVIRAPVFRELALGAFTVVTCTVISALTLLPAVLALLGRRINSLSLPARMQPPDSRGESTGAGGWNRWARAVMRRPVTAAATSGLVLILAATPLSKLHTGIDFGIASLSDTPSGKGAEVLGRSFGAGALAPIEIVLSAPAGSGPRPASVLAQRTAALARELQRDRANVAGLSAVSSNDAQLLTVAPAGAVDSSLAEHLVRHIRAVLAPPLRANGGPAIVVGGASAKIVDLSNETRAKFPLVLGLILALSLIFLTVAFRSLVLPVKAVMMNVLATAATVGVLVLVFQDGHGSGLLNFTSTGYIQVYLPLSVFALLFGLSMDYEVFLIRRMQETWRATHDNQRAVATGLAHTARPISAAAAIMVAVFGSFVTANVLELKEYGFGLALAIALDATLIRLVLVPALMRLLGERNWWFPGRSGHPLGIPRGERVGQAVD